MQQKRDREGRKRGGRAQLRGRRHDWQVQAYARRLISSPCAHASESTMGIRRVLRDYGLATFYGAGGNPIRFLPMAMRVSRARYRYGIGPRNFSLLGLAQVAESGWDSYLGKCSVANSILGAVNPEEMHRLARNKVLFYEHCLRAGLPTIPIVCRVGGTPDPLGDSVEHVKDPGRLAVLLESSPPRLFAKVIDGAHGAGAFLIVRHPGHLEFLGQKGNAADLIASLQQRCGANSGFILQPQMRPHEQMRPFASANGLPTVRIITAMCADGPRALFACFNVPVGDCVIDNFANGMSGNLLVSIDMKDGTLGPALVSRNRHWPAIVSVDVRPDTGYPITGSRLPFWAEMVETALRGQQTLPDFKTIGWDVAATDEGVVLVEANSKYDVRGMEVACRRGLKAEFATGLGITIG